MATRKAQNINGVAYDDSCCEGFTRHSNLQKCEFQAKMPFLQTFADSEVNGKTYSDTGEASFPSKWPFH